MNYSIEKLTASEAETDAVLTKEEPEVIVKAEHLIKYYPTGSEGFFLKNKKVLHALDDVSISVKKGEIFGVVGESGCGKSTLGRCLLRLIDLTDGKITFQGDEISNKTGRELKPLRHDMQMIFQNPFSSFNPKLTIGKSLFELGRVHGMSQNEMEEKILKLLDYINLPQDVLSRSPKELSGGQLQRLAIARALLLNPSFIVADEPVSALDVSVQAQILNLIQDMREEFQMTMLFISHELTVVEYLCDTIAVMYLGQVVECAPTEELFSNILHPYTQALMSAIPKADPELTTERIMLKGEIPNAIDVPQGCRFASRCDKCMDICRTSKPELKPVNKKEHFVACHLVNQL